MNALYWLRPPVEPAQPPPRWSYSSLTAWRQCPRQWWLLRSRYENAPGTTYPTVFGAAAVQGRLVHEALEARRTWGRGAGQAGRFDARRFMKGRLRELLDGEVTANPRLDAGRIQAAFSLDESLAKFFALAGPPGAFPDRHARGPAGTGSSDRPPTHAEEFWLEVDDPPLGGRIDRVRRGVLVDFKTGEPDAEVHGLQLRFYAALWWLRYGRAPEGLELHYPDVVRQLPVPDDGEIVAEISGLRSEIASIERALNGLPPPARPGPELCRYCPVRQLCDEYWTAEATESLRRPDAQVVEDGKTVLQDVRITALPQNWSPGSPLAGTGYADGLGAVEITLASRLCPGAGEGRPTEGRLLQVLLRSGDGGWSLRPAASSEAFWSD